MSLVSNAVAIANTVTKNLKLQSTVTQEKSAGMDRYGKHIYPTSVIRDAVVDKSLRTIKTAEGELVQSKTSITFLDPAIIVDYTDRLTLADGTTGPILLIGGFVDGETNRQALAEVFLG
jgi:hypothetical protein